jgi:cytochrome P450
VLVPALERRLAARAAERGEDGLVRDDLIDLSRATLIPMICSLIGIDGVDDEGAVAAIHRYSEVFGEGASSEWLTDGEERTRILERAVNAKREFGETFYRRSKERRERLLAEAAAGNGPAPPVDLITLLLRDGGVDDAEMLTEVAFFFIASTNTTSHAVPHVFDELWRWLERHPDQADRLDDPEFLRAAAAEALRLHPPVPSLIRKSLCPVDLATGRHLAESERVAVDLNAINRDTAIVDHDPHGFDPDRALRSLPKWAYSFGIGPHTCLGRAFAMSGPKAPVGGRSSLGAVVRIVSSLLEAGIAPDPAAPPPRLRTDTASDRFAGFPIVLRNL